MIRYKSNDIVTYFAKSTVEDNNVSASEVTTQNLGKKRVCIKYHEKTTSYGLTTDTTASGYSPKINYNGTNLYFGKLNMNKTVTTTTNVNYIDGNYKAQASINAATLNISTEGINTITYNSSFIHFTNAGISYQTAYDPENCVSESYKHIVPFSISTFGYTKEYTTLSDTSNYTSVLPTLATYTVSLNNYQYNFYNNENYIKFYTSNIQNLIILTEGVRLELFALKNYFNATHSITSKMHCIGNTYTTTDWRGNSTYSTKRDKASGISCNDVVSEYSYASSYYYITQYRNNSYTYTIEKSNCTTLLKSFSYTITDLVPWKYAYNSTQTGTNFDIHSYDYYALFENRIQNHYIKYANPAFINYFGGTDEGWYASANFLLGGQSSYYFTSNTTYLSNIKNNIGIINFTTEIDSDSSNYKTATGSSSYTYRTTIDNWRQTVTKTVTNVYFTSSKNLNIIFTKSRFTMTAPMKCTIPSTQNSTNHYTDSHAIFSYRRMPVVDGLEYTKTITIPLCNFEQINDYKFYQDSSLYTYYNYSTGLSTSSTISDISVNDSTVASNNNYTCSGFSSFVQLYDDNYLAGTGWVGYNTANKINGNYISSKTSGFGTCYYYTSFHPLKHIVSQLTDTRNYSISSTAYLTDKELYPNVTVDHFVYSYYNSNSNVTTSYGVYSYTDMNKSFAPLIKLSNYYNFGFSKFNLDPVLSTAVNKVFTNYPDECFYNFFKDSDMESLELTINTSMIQLTKYGAYYHRSYYYGYYSLSGGITLRNKTTVGTTTVTVLNSDYTTRNDIFDIWDTCIYINMPYLTISMNPNINV